MSRMLDLGVSEVSGVPCSLLTPVINRAISDPAVRFLPVSQEGEAVSIAAGAWLGGGLGWVIAQNPGLRTMVGPLTSLMPPARMPALLAVTWRGRPGHADEPQHRLMGAITHRLLGLMLIGHTLLPSEPGALRESFEAADRHLRVRSL